MAGDSQAAAGYPVTRSRSVPESLQVPALKAWIAGIMKSADIALEATQRAWVDSF
jgi:hypothetical protein